MGLSLEATSRGYSSLHWLLTVVASLVAEHRLWGTWASALAVCGLNSYGSWALEHRLTGLVAP